MSRKDVSYEPNEPIHPKVFAVVLLVISLVAIGVVVLFAFLADVVNQYLQLDPKIHRLMISGPLSFAIAVVTTLAFFYIIYTFLYKSYRA